MNDILIYIYSYVTSPQFIMGILTGLVASIIKNIFDYYASRRRDYSGSWIDEIENNSITGKARRIFPVEESDRKYDIVGKIRDKSMIVVFNQINETGNSYGCLHAMRIEDGVYKGFYISGTYLEKIGGDNVDGSHPTKITLKKASPGFGTI